MITTTSPVTVEENKTAVATLAATDADDDSINWVTLGGADERRFALGWQTGVLTFKAAPDFERPTDALSVDPANDAENNQYVVFVIASDGSSTDKLQLVVKVTDDDTERPAKPAKPTVTAVTGLAELSVTWEEPDLNGGPAITGYRVDYRKEPHGRWTRSSYSGTGDSTTITGLTAHTPYQVRVKARNGERDSDWSDPSDAVSTAGPTCTLDPGDPGDVWCGVVTVEDTRGRHGRGHAVW